MSFLIIDLPRLRQSFKMEKVKDRRPPGKYRRLFPAFFLLGLINFLFLLPVVIFLEWQYLIPAFALLGAFNLFLFFSYEKRLFLSLSLTPFPKEDPWSLQAFLKKSNPSLPTTLHLIKTSFPLSLCLGGQGYCRIVFSEKLLERLTPEEREMIVSYYIQAGNKGWVFFLTLLSACIQGLNWFFSIVSLPDRIIQKERKMNVVLRLILHGFSPFSRKIFSHLDKTMEGQTPKKLARTLWKMQSLYNTELCLLPVFLAPLCFTNPLTDLKTGRHILFQPDKRQRTEALIGTYPP